MMDAAAWSLLHFLWEGTLVVALVFFPLRFLRQASARYVVGCAAMLLMLVLPVATFIFIEMTRDVHSPSHTAGFTAASSSIMRFVAAATVSHAEWTSLVVAVWAIGVALVTLRNAGGLLLAYLWGRRAVMAAPSECYDAVLQVASRLRLRCAIRLRMSCDGVAPMVLGWIQPVVVIPTIALKLPLQQLEALLAHELAHIRRHDFLVNLVQKGVETLLFYHPAVWWLGSRIRDERENCCDDLAVRVCGDRVVYARALTSLEELRVGASQFAMAASGGSLVRRIARLLGTKYPAYGSSVWLVAVIAACGIAAFAGIALRAEQKNVVPSAAIAKPAVTAPEPVSTLGARTRAAESRPASQAQARQSPEGAENPTAPDSQSYIGQLVAAGYTDLSIDDLIAFKVHGVTAEYIRGLQAVGLKPSASELVASRIHGVTADYAKALQADGFNLTMDQLIAGRIHGVNPDTVAQLKAAGFPSLTFDQVLTARIHGITPEAVRELKDSGIGDLSFEDLVTARIHGVTGAFVRKALQSGLKNLTFDKIVQLKIHRLLD
jgi:beta-lactamase regulating signal transducer with metallopeptidase domain